MWVAKDLPPGQLAIPCSEVVGVKCGPDSEVQSYQVRIVAGGHRQIEGVNYTETFLAATKIPTYMSFLPMQPTWTGELNISTSKVLTLMHH